jgi:hypothetical protein
LLWKLVLIATEGCEVRSNAPRRECSNYKSDECERSKSEEDREKALEALKICIYITGRFKASTELKLTVKQPHANSSDIHVIVL